MALPLSKWSRGPWFSSLVFENILLIRISVLLDIGQDQLANLSFKHLLCYKVRWFLLQSASAFSILESASTVYYKVCQLFVLQGVLIFITKCVRLFITKCVDFYYKVRQVLQSASKCITKCGRYYKVWFLLQSEL